MCISPVQQLSNAFTYILYTYTRIINSYGYFNVIIILLILCVSIDILYMTVVTTSFIIHFFYYSFYDEINRFLRFPILVFL